ncbi:ShlB/FhaC/HecB family hemolysin secretion/activation protein [Propionivibrio sp.]|uniref:ShlB/FhaC/HecB family hemolysin secretion/activation protein n=1 Tax=Propionivibrio sp. TaxID=2212460 RepID=UPI00260D6030|nr:ShlB/FhaC/HecB family hemolysin secretion/activation protein [Propionivibrio sp.]
MHHQQRKLSRTGFVLAFAAVVASQQLFAAQPPDAGQLLPSAPFAPLPPSNPSPVFVTPVDKVEIVPDSEVRIMVSRIRITGNTAFSEAQLQELIAPALEPEAGTPPGNGAIAGRQMTFAELQALAERITAHYREHGYLLARAYLPAQEVAQGQLEMTVLEGRISRINWRNESRHTDATVQSHLAELPLDRPLYNPTLERSLLLLNDLPGSDAQATIRPGVSVGTSELDIQMSDRKGLLAGNVSLDNEGNRYSGEYRLGACLSLNSPLHLGDSLDLRLLGGGRGFHYGRLAWQVPLRQQGLTVGVAASSMDYSLLENFAPLKAHGTARIGSIYAIYPLLRSRFSNINAQLAYDHKQLDDRVDASASIVNRTLDVWQTGLSGSRTDGLGGGGLNNWSLTAVAGKLSLDPAAQAIDAATVRTEGNYSKSMVQFARTQRLADAWNLYGQISGQATQKNLDNSEKYSLGGSSAVRAYPQGEAPVDDGWVSTVELRYTPTPNWQVSLFNDAAQGRLQHSPAITASRNERRLSGYGLGLTYADNGGLSVQVTLAWRSGETPTADNDRSPRGWLRLLHPF